MQYWLFGSYNYRYLCTPQARLAAARASCIRAAAAWLPQLCAPARHLAPMPRPARALPPQWPWCTGGKARPPPTFFGRDSFLGVATATLMGLQHAMAMLAGMTTVPYLIGANAFSDPTITADQALDYQQVGRRATRGGRRAQPQASLLVSSGYRPVRLQQMQRQATGGRRGVRQATSGGRRWEAGLTAPPHLPHCLPPPLSSCPPRST